MIVNAGLVRIVYDEPYPDAAAERLLADASIALSRFAPAGSGLAAAPGDALSPAEDRRSPDLRPAVAAGGIVPDGADGA
jgi:deoxycytidylate deaminase